MLKCRVILNIQIADFGRGKKAYVILLARELQILLNGSETLLDIKPLITEDDQYDEEVVKSLFETILQEKQENLAKEEHEKLRLENFEREKKLRAENFEREEKLRQENMDHEAKKLGIGAKRN